MGAVAAFLVGGFAIAWLVASTPLPQQQLLNLFHVFVPGSLFIGIGGMWLAIRAVMREGWSDRAEGVASLSFLIFSWGNYGAWVAVRRAAQLEGYVEAVQFDTSPYRLFTGCVLVGATLLVIRWLTRREFGEWGWAAVALGWTVFVVIDRPMLHAMLVWLYVMWVA